MLGGRADTEGCNSVKLRASDDTLFHGYAPTCTEVEAAFDGWGGAMREGATTTTRAQGLDDVRNDEEKVKGKGNNERKLPGSGSLGWARLLGYAPVKRSDKSAY